MVARLGTVRTDTTCARTDSAEPGAESSTAYVPGDIGYDDRAQHFPRSLHELGSGEVAFNLLGVSDVGLITVVHVPTLESDVSISLNEQMEQPEQGGHAPRASRPVQLHPTAHARGPRGARVRGGVEVCAAGTPGLHPTAHACAVGTPGLHPAAHACAAGTPGRRRDRTSPRRGLTPLFVRYTRAVRVSRRSTGQLVLRREVP